MKQNQKRTTRKKSSAPDSWIDRFLESRGRTLLNVILTIAIMASACTFTTAARATKSWQAIALAILFSGASVVGVIMVINDIRKILSDEDERTKK